MIAKEERLTPAQAALYLGCSVNFVRVRAREGSLKSYRLGSRYFFAKNDLDNLVVVKGPHELNGQLDI